MRVVSAALALFGCKRDGKSDADKTTSSATEATTLAATTAPVRDAFNRDVGSARVIMLVSPT